MAVSHYSDHYQVVRPVAVSTTSSPSFAALLRSFWRRIRSLFARTAARTPSPHPLDVALFTQRYGYAPRRVELFVKALVHRSYLPYSDDATESNERLEFLGDAILNFIVAEHLYFAFPGLHEGELTKRRSRLVNGRTLARIARRNDLERFLKLSTSAAIALESGSDSILADAFEAVLGAIYLDGGVDQARAFVQRTIFADKDAFLLAAVDENYKSALLEYAQGRALGVPRYITVREEGPDHDRRFTVEVHINGTSYGSGLGKNKKEAEQSAAMQALGEFKRRETEAAAPPVPAEPGDAEE